MSPIYELMGKFKKNVTVQFFYPHALNMEYFLFKFIPQRCVLIPIYLLPNLK